MEKFNKKITKAQQHVSAIANEFPSENSSVLTNLIASVEKY